MIHADCRVELIDLIRWAFTLNLCSKLCQSLVSTLNSSHHVFVCDLVLEVRLSVQILRFDIADSLAPRRVEEY
jgi:hypothetical protein